MLLYPEFKEKSINNVDLLLDISGNILFMLYNANHRMNEIQKARTKVVQKNVSQEVNKVYRA